MTIVLQKTGRSHGCGVTIQPARVSAAPGVGTRGGSSSPVHVSAYGVPTWEQWNLSLPRRRYRLRQQLAHLSLPTCTQSSAALNFYIRAERQNGSSALPEKNRAPSAIGLPARTSRAAKTLSRSRRRFAPNLTRFETASNNSNFRFDELVPQRRKTDARSAARRLRADNLASPPGHGDRGTARKPRDPDRENAGRRLGSAERRALQFQIRRSVVAIAITNGSERMVMCAWRCGEAISRSAT